MREADKISNFRIAACMVVGLAFYVLPMFIIRAVTIGWNANTNATSYTVRIGRPGLPRTNLFAVTSKTNFVWTNRFHDGTWSVTVSSTSNAVTGPESAELIFTNPFPAVTLRLLWSTNGPNGPWTERSLALPATYMTTNATEVYKLSISKTNI